jgi:hypothetical protein
MNLVIKNIGQVKTKSIVTMMMIEIKIMGTKRVLRSPINKNIGQRINKSSTSTVIVGVMAQIKRK